MKVVRTGLMLLLALSLLSLFLFYRSSFRRASASPLQEGLFYEEAKSRDLIRKAMEYERKGMWKEVVLLCMQLLEKYPNETHPVGAGGEIDLSESEEKSPAFRIGVAEWVMRKFRGFPPEGLRAYRDQLGYDAKAKREIDEGRRENDPERIAAAVHRWFLASASDEAIDELANRHFERGETAEAVNYWRRLLRFYPDSSLPKELLTARIAFALSLSRAPADPAESSGTAGIDRQQRLVFGGEARSVEDILRAAEEIPAKRREGDSAGRRPPSIPEASSMSLSDGSPAIRTDVRRWERKVGGVADPIVEELRLRGYPVRGSARSFAPLFVTLGERKYVIAQDGLSVTAVEPSSGSLYWSETRGVFPSTASEGRNEGLLSLLPMIFGCVADGNQVFVNQYRLRGLPAVEENHRFPRAIRALDIRTGKLVWDSEDVNRLEFDKSAMVFATPPTVSGNKVFAVATSAPPGEMEIVLYAFDRKNGRMLWKTFLTSLYGTDRSSGGYLSRPPPPAIAVADGMVYCQTNIGNVASLYGMTGEIQWVAEYRKEAAERRWRGGLDASNGARIRSGIPIVHGETLYILPADSTALLAVERETGKIDEDFFPLQATGWSLTAMIDGHLCLSGPDESVVDVRNEKRQKKTLANVGSVSGSGFCANGFYYIPCGNELVVYQPGSWRRVVASTSTDSVWDATVAGNLIVAGSYLVSQTADGRLVGLTSQRVVEEEYATLLRQDPVAIDRLLEFGRLMMRNKRYQAVVDRYSQVLRLVEGSNDHCGMEQEARENLVVAHLKLGEEWEKKKSIDRGPEIATAVEMYATAKRYASREEQVASAALGLARLHEESKEWGKAAAEYQDILQRCTVALFPLPGEDGNLDGKVWGYARRRVNDLIREQGEAVYAPFEAAAAAAVAGIGEGDLPALTIVAGRYPNSRAAAGALRRASELLFRREQWGEWLALWQTIRRFAPSLAADPDIRVRRIEALKKRDDWDKIDGELALLAEQAAPSLEVGTLSGRMRLEQFLRSEGEEIARRRKSMPPLRAPLRLQAKMKRQSSGGRRGEERTPLTPSGRRPSFLSQEREFFKEGSSVVLCDIGEGKDLLHISHPGGFPGFSIRREAGSGETVVLEILSSTMVARDLVDPSRPSEDRFRPGDILKTIDGTPVEFETFWRIVTAKPPGTKVRIAGTRDGVPFDREVVLDPFPATGGPLVVAAAFTGDDRLAVAWEDLVACFDPATGALRWVHHPVDSRSLIEELAVVDGRVVVGEVISRNRWVWDETWMRASEQQDESAREVTDRVIGIDEETGATTWVRRFVRKFRSFDYRDIFAFLSSSGGSDLFVAYTPMPPGYSPEQAKPGIWLLDSEAGTVRKNISIGAQWFFLKNDPSSGRVALASLQSDGELRLTVLSVDARRNGGKIGELWNKKWRSEQFQSQPHRGAGRIAIGGDWVAVLQSATQIKLYRALDGSGEREIALPAGRIIPSETSVCAFAPDGTFFLFTIAGNEGERRQGTGLAFVTAFDATGKIVWEEHAPFASGMPPILFADQPKVLLLFASSAYPPGAEGGGSSMALLYSTESGAIVNEFPNLRPIAVGNKSEQTAVWVTGGRIHISGKDGLELYGN